MRHPELAAGEIAADAVTADLRTSGNALSFWRCGSPGEAEVERIALAMAAAGDRIDRLDLVWISEEHLAADGQTWEGTAGHTPIVESRSLHVDVLRLDYVRLGSVAHRVADAIANGRCVRFTRTRVRELLVAAVTRGDVAIADLADRVRDEVGAALQAF